MRFDTGPNLANIGERAASRVEGLSAEDYLRESILHPLAYIVPGFRGSMYGFYSQTLSQTDIDALIAYLMTL